MLPSCIVEFTAHPGAGAKQPSNVLHHVSAAELKAAEMVKLPLRVVTRHPSQSDQLLADAITVRGDSGSWLSRRRRATGEYLAADSVASRRSGWMRANRCASGWRGNSGVAKDEVKISVGSLDELPSAEEISSPKVSGAIHHHCGEAARGVGLPVCLRAVQSKGNALGDGHRANRRAHPSVAGGQGESSIPT